MGDESVLCWINPVGTGSLSMPGVLSHHGPALEGTGQVCLPWLSTGQQRREALLVTAAFPKAPPPAPQEALAFLRRGPDVSPVLGTPSCPVCGCSPLPSLRALPVCTGGAHVHVKQCISCSYSVLVTVADSPESEAK